MSKTLPSIFLALAVLLVSCSSDDDNAQMAENLNIAFYTLKTHTTDGGNVYEAYMRGNIVNNKYYSETYLDPQTFQEQTHQLYEYTGDLLTSYGTGYVWETYHYDSQKRLIAASFGDDTMNTYYRRFAYQSDAKVFAEILTQPYDSPDTQVLERYVLTFDANANVIAAGPDNDLDGTIDQESHFTYANGNLVSAELYNGSQMDYAYSGVVNNFSVLSDNTYGKKNARLLRAEAYSGGSLFFLRDHNRNVIMQEFEQAQYEVLPNGYYRKSSRSYPFEGGVTDATYAFFFL